MSNYYPLLTGLLCLLLSGQITGQTCTSTQSGLWENASTWGGTSPGSCTHFVISAGTTVTIDRDPTINVTNGSVTVNGTLNIAGGFLLDYAILNLINSPLIILPGGNLTGNILSYLTSNGIFYDLFGFFTSGTYAEIVAAGGLNANGTFLPIELLVFTGHAVDDAIHLSWTTASELNNDYMAVERSGDGLAFDEIGRIAGRGTTYEAQTYTFVDEYPVPGVNYYRLRQVDFDGTTEYHPVISVVFKGKNEVRLRISPNPVREELRVQWAAGGDQSGVLRLFDPSGRQLAQYVLNGSGGVYNVPVAPLPAGVYVLQLTQGGRVQVQRFVKE